MGSWSAIWVLIALVLTALWRRPNILLVVATTALTTQLITTLIKLAVDRERPPTVVLDPEPLLDPPTSSSFPSGHSSSSFACAYVLSRFAPRLTALFYALALGIAFSRVYVGVHYPIDVLVGAALGTLVAIALLRLLGGLQRSRRSPPAG